MKTLKAALAAIILIAPAAASAGSKSGVDGTLDVTQVGANGAAPSTANGATDTGTQRVTISSDSTGQVKLATGANTIGTLTANQSVNISQVAGAARSVNSGAADVGTARAVLSDDGLSVVSALPYPNGATPVTATSGSIANTASTLNLPAVAGKTTYMSGLEVTGLGATAAGSIAVSIYFGGTAKNLYFIIQIPAGVTTGITPLVVQFNPPLSSGAVNSVIQTTMPAFGSGNMAANLNVHGFQY
ncbi:MAG TPA: hypothetical protein VII63_08485 [Caulobacteraceae bacterium]